MIKPNTNYVLLTNYIEIYHYILGFILKINSDKGILHSHNLFTNKIVTISNKATPNTNQIVISNTIRNNKEFITITPQNKELIKFLFYINKREINPYKTQIEALQTQTKYMQDIEIFYVTLAVLNTDLTNQAIEAIIASVGGISQHSKYKQIIQFLVNPNKDTHKAILQMIHSNYKETLYLLATLLKDTPQFIVDKYQVLLQTQSFLSNLLKLAKIALQAQNKHYCNLAIIKEFNIAS